METNKGKDRRINNCILLFKTMKIIAFTKHNPKFKAFNRPEEDSFRFKQHKNKVIIAVADGITRDPIGIKEFPENPDKETIKKTMKKYPNPSPAKIAADIFCDSIIKNLDKPNLNFVKEAINYANNEICQLNQKNNPLPNYLEKDIWACVGSCGLIENKALYFGYICDCGVCVFDKGGKLKFRTEDEGPNKHDKEIWNSSLLKGKKWNNAEARRIVRSHFRNNLKESNSYGAFTGEKTAMPFVKVGKIPLEKNDYILFYTDGCAKIIYSKNFDICKSFNFLERYIEENSENLDGSEGTIVAIHID